MNKAKRPIPVSIIAMFLFFRAAVYGWFFLEQISNSGQMLIKSDLDAWHQLVLSFLPVVGFIALGWGLWTLKGVSSKALALVFGLNLVFGRTALGLMVGFQGIHGRLSDTQFVSEIIIELMIVLYLFVSTKTRVAFQVSFEPRDLPYARRRPKPDGSRNKYSSTL